MTHSGYSSPGTGPGDFRNLTPLVLMKALKRAGTEVCEPVHLFRLEAPIDTLGQTLSALARLQANPTATSTGESSYTLEGEILATRMHQLEQQLRAVTRGEGVLAFTFSRYQPVRGTVPSRPRTDHNPLNYGEYLLRITRRVKGGQQ